VLSSTQFATPLILLIIYWLSSSALPLTEGLHLIKIFEPLLIDIYIIDYSGLNPFPKRIAELKTDGKIAQHAMQATASVPIAGGIREEAATAMLHCLQHGRIKWQLCLWASG
jgi:hypothetical protein